MCCVKGAEEGREEQTNSWINAYFKTLGNNQPRFLVNLPIYSACSFFNLFNKPSVGILTVPGSGSQEQESDKLMCWSQSLSEFLLLALLRLLNRTPEVIFSHPNAVIDGTK